MIGSTSRLAGLTVLALAVSAYGSSIKVSPASKACQLLQKSFPTLVSFPNSQQYDSDIGHWAATSTQNATCSIQPSSADDIASIMKIIGRSDIRAPFAVKSGGHTFNSGVSSTTGVQISMAKFNGLSYDKKTNTVTIGTGLTWDQVYSRLEPMGIMVTGGRAVGVGVGGLSLGGGFSWKTNQFGLTIDTIVSHNIVLPSGQKLFVSNTSNPDLFFGLKGGLNNFGIVTNITFKAHPQGQVYGGTITYASNATDALNAAISNFSATNADPKAQLVGAYTSAGGQFSGAATLFYDGPTPPKGVFDAFLSIPSTSFNVKTRTFVDFMSVVGEAIFVEGPFGSADTTIPITHYPTALLEKMAQQVAAAGTNLTAASKGANVVVLVLAEPFLNPFSHSTGGAYPHPPSRQVTPTGTEVQYQLNPNLTPAAQSAFNDLAVTSLKQFSNSIQAEAVSQGVSAWDDILYPNYAIAGTPVQQMFGSNVQKLRQIASKYDPNGIMKLTGGPHF